MISRVGLICWPDVALNFYNKPMAAKIEKTLVLLKPDGRPSGFNRDDNQPV